jgi:hypothetical protein
VSSFKSRFYLVHVVIYSLNFEAKIKATNDEIN